MRTEDTNKYCIGVFPMQADLLHPGHLSAIEEASRYCEKLIILLNYSDNKITQVETLMEKYLRLRAVKYVSEIIPYCGEIELLELLKLLTYDVRFVGEDYKGKDYTGKEYELQKDITIIYLNRQHSYSSTEYRERLRRINDGKNC